MSASPSPVSISRHGEIAVVSIQNPPVNALSKSVRIGLLDAFNQLKSDDSIKSVILSGGPGRFIAGADLNEMDREPEGPYLPEVVEEIEAFPKPVIAAIDGAALGGGLEIALVCDVRIGGARASVGLTETRLGIVPGAGGTQRLPRLVGVAKAIEMICGGSIISAKDAVELGVLDAIALDDAQEEAVKRAGSCIKRRVSMLTCPESAPEDEQQAIAAARKAARGLAAIEEALRLVQLAAKTTIDVGLAEERATFLRLRRSDEARALRHLFFASREASKAPGLETASARPFEATAVIGAGTMGAGIAVAFADAGLSVALLERDQASASAGLNRVRAIYERLVESGRLSTAQMERRLGLILATDDWEVLRTRQLIVEAAFEDMQVKKEIFHRIDELAPEGAVLASNTSYLDLNAIASATRRPSDVIGLHFFSPANVMKLLEIVRCDLTSQDTLATGLALAKRLGKQPVIARVCDGFIGNRIYAVYRRHAEYLVEDGASPEEIDSALEAYGFAMGIFSVSDMSGLDIAFAMRKRRGQTRDPGERYVTIPDRLCAAGRLGRKSGAGWYAYSATGKRRPDPYTASIIDTERRAKGIQPRKFTAQKIVRRLLAVMANEGARELSEGIALRPSDIDLAFVNGYGFPKWKGGPMWAADQIGLPIILQEMETAHEAGGVGSEPAPLIVELARSGKSFADLQNNQNPREC
jgi:3-hydroxyacyl-CoA dehydrogenase